MRHLQGRFRRTCQTQDPSISQLVPRDVARAVGKKKAFRLHKPSSENKQSSEKKKKKIQTIRTHAGISETNTKRKQRCALAQVADKIFWMFVSPHHYISEL